MLTRKYYKAIAEVIKESNSTNDIITGLSNIFNQDNPNFDRSKFWEACQKNEKE